MHKRYRYILGVLLAFALVAAACGDDDDTSATTAAPTTAAPTTAAPTTAAPTTAAPTTAAPTTTEPAGPPEPGPLGQVVVAPGEDIQIRSLQAISGPVAFLGIPNQRGTQFAIDDYGQIKGHNVSLGTPLDDLCSADGGQAAAQTIVADESVVGVIGTSCSGAAVAAAPLISEAGMVMISPSNTSPALTSDLQGNAGTDYQPGYYRTAHNDLFQGAGVARFVFEELGLTKAAAIHDGDPYTQGLARAFGDSFEVLGGELVDFTGVNKGDTDMTGVLSSVAGFEPEVLFFPIFQPEGDFIVQQIGGVSGFEDVVLIGADGLLVSDFLALSESTGMYFSGPDLRFGENASETGVTADDFLTRYEADFGSQPEAAFWAHSYDATVMLLTAIDNVAVDVDGTLYIDRQALRDELNGVTDFGGIIGLITCDEFGDCGAQRISVVEHEGDPVAAVNNVIYSATRADLIDLITGG
jgi:branched-chain amino acid transport system substrate-binding protein